MIIFNVYTIVHLSCIVIFENLLARELVINKIHFSIILFSKSPCGLCPRATRF